MEILQAGAEIRKCLEAEGFLGIIKMRTEIQTTTTLFEFTSLVSPETYLRMDNSPQKEGKQQIKVAKMARGV